MKQQQQHAYETALQHREQSQQKIYRDAALVGILAQRTVIIDEHDDSERTEYARIAPDGGLFEGRLAPLPDYSATNDAPQQESQLAVKKEASRMSSYANSPDMRVKRPLPELPLSKLYATFLPPLRHADPHHTVCVERQIKHIEPLSINALGDTYRSVVPSNFYPPENSVMNEKTAASTLKPFIPESTQKRRYWNPGANNNQ
jgi:hypothetical protein